MGTGRRLKDGLTGLRTAITVSALAATVIGWAVLAGDREVPPVATLGAETSGAPTGTLVSVDTRPLPPRRAPAPRPDVRTRASRRR